MSQPPPNDSSSSSSNSLKLRTRPKSQSSCQNNDTSSVAISGLKVGELNRRRSTSSSPSGRHFVTRKTTTTLVTSSSRGDTPTPWGVVLKPIPRMKVKFAEEKEKEESDLRADEKIILQRGTVPNLKMRAQRRSEVAKEISELEKGEDEEDGAAVVDKDDDNAAVKDKVHPRERCRFLFETRIPDSRLPRPST